MNEVFETKSFSEAFDSFEKEEQRWIVKIKEQLKSNLFVGKPLRFSWFREKKYWSKRLYYFVNLSTGKALLVIFSDKKHQRKIIKYLLANREKYLKLIQ